MKLNVLLQNNLISNPSLTESGNKKSPFSVGEGVGDEVVTDLFEQIQLLT